MAFNLADFVEHAVDTMPERTALVCGDRRETFAAFDGRANRLAHHLADLGLGERDHVAIYAYNCIEFVEVMIAAFKIRAVPINVNYRYVEEELLYLLDNSDARALVFQAQFAPLADKVRDRLPLLEHLIVIDDGTEDAVADLGAIPYEDALAASSPDRDFGPRSDDDRYILYTGGTTGYPKGVVWRHEDVWRVLGGGIDFMTGERIDDEHAMARLGAEAEPSSALVLAPLMHGAAQWGTLGSLFKGVTAVILPRFDAAAVWRAVGEHGISGISITGDAMAMPLLDELEDGDYDVGSLVSFSSTAAVFSPVVKDRLFRLLTGVYVAEAVGSSESGFNGMRLIEADNTATSGGLINVPLGPDTLVIGDDGRPAAPGEVGRMARGGNVPVEYYKDPERSAATFIEVDGARYSVPGDLARLEEDGTMTLLGRGSQCINSGGEKIYPEEVESALKAHPGVFDALVVGLEDERWGQSVAALVQSRGETAPDLDALDSFCRTRIAGYKIPRHLFIVDEMPRHPSGKPDYRRARAIAEEAPQ